MQPGHGSKGHPAGVLPVFFRIGKRLILMFVRAR